MALTTGINEVTSGTRASKEFDFRGGGIGYMVIDVPNTTPDWDLQLQMPDDTQGACECEWQTGRFS